LEFREQKLKNGLTIIAECNPQAHSQAVGFFVRAGSRDETDDIAGVSHFLEHMVFKGTDTRTVDDVNRELDELSPHYNAATSEETTIYYAMVLPECQDRVVSLWADVLRPALRTEDFETEKQVIVEEILKYDDQPPFGADDRCRELYFGDHPLGRSILGTVESIRELKVEAMRAYFDQRYGADNVVLAAAGRVDFDALVASAQRCCGHWEPGGVARLVAPATPWLGFLVLNKPIATHV
jgi:predicted Zn-dependent peptidase